MKQETYAKHVGVKIKGQTLKGFYGNSIDELGRKLNVMISENQHFEVESL